MRIVWDITKAAVNLRKHGVELSHAATVLDDPMAVTVEDTRQGEQRFVTVGSDLLGRIVVVVYTYPECRRDPIDFGEKGNSQRAEDL